MYCQKCGKEIDESSTFCSACGSSQGSSNQNNQPGYGQPNYGPGGYNTVVQEKNTGLALILAFIIIGAGHLYIGKVKEGITYFLAACIISVVVWIVFWPLSIIILVLWLWNIYDAYTNAKKFNDHLRQTGTPLW